MLTTLIGATLVVVLFAALAHVIGLVRWTGEVVTQAKNAAAVMQNKNLSDHAKETAIQSAAISMFKLLGLLIAGSTIAIAAPLALMWLADQFELLSFDAVMAMLVRWEFLIAATVIGFGVYFGLRRLSRR